MKLYIQIIFFLTASYVSTGQIDSSNRNVRNAVNSASGLIQAALGKDLSKRYVFVDYKKSYQTTTLLYSNDDKNPHYVELVKAYKLNFHIIKQNDTIAYLSFVVDTTGKLIKGDYWHDSNSSPQELVGYRRVLMNDFKISFDKAVEILRSKGFTGIPFLIAQPDYKFATIDKHTYIKVNYYWVSYEKFMGQDSQSSLKINAETGEIDIER